MFSHYKGGARKRKYSFELNIQEFESLIKQNCSYCGIEPFQKSLRNRKEIYFYNGIDRIDNSIGYTLTNSIPCCKICNKAKNNLSLDKWNNWTRRFTTYNKGKYENS